MNQIKKLDYIREKERDIFITSKNEINEVENEYELKVYYLNKQYEILKEKEDHLKKNIENVREQINKLNFIFQSGKYDKKYINSSEVIVVL